MSAKGKTPPTKQNAGQLFTRVNAENQKESTSGSYSSIHDNERSVVAKINDL
jgi:hypothetical protein